MRTHRIGYKRVSTVDQNTERQLDGVAVDQVFEDKKSGKSKDDRPQLQLMLSRLTEGDEVLVHSMDRLARNLPNLLDLVKQINARGASITFVKESLTFAAGTEANPMATLQLQILGAVAEFERAMIRERQREGIALAKERGDVYKGRPKGPVNPKADELRRRIAGGEKVARVARDLGVSRQTAYEWMKAAEA